MDLLELYRLLTEISKEAIDLQLRAIERDKILDSEKDHELIERVRNSYRVHVTITDSDGGSTFGSDEEVFSESTFPKKLAQAFYSTSTEYNTLTNGVDPLHRAIVLLDFNRPFAIDFVNLPSFPTKNASSFEVSGRDLTWVNGVFQRLTSLLSSKDKNIEWIHRQGVYDLALWFVGIPFVFWILYRISGIVNIAEWNDFFRVGVYIFLFFILANVFKFLFTYARWIYPLMEFKGSNGSTSSKHRTTLLAAIMAIVLAALYDAGKLWLL